MLSCLFFSIHPIAVTQGSSVSWYGVFNTAFNSQFPVALKTEYLIDGHPNAVVHAMLKHIYGSPLEAPPDMVSVEDQIDYLFNIFAIANEYEVPFLGEAATQRIFRIMNGTIFRKFHYADNNIGIHRKSSAII
ncbi:hypothetical protein KCV05_g917, partial [Aureobasidium melanogenum]